MSRPLRPSLRLLVGLAAAVLVLGACTGARQIPDKYGDTTSKNFSEGCIDSMTSGRGEGEAFSRTDARAVCSCAYDGITDAQDGIPFEEFKRITEEQEEDPADLPPRFREIIADCVDTEAAPS